VVMMSTLAETSDIGCAQASASTCTSSSGTGRHHPVGDVIVDGDVDTRMGISMTAGVVYVAGVVKVPIGNVIEVASDRSEYRK